MTRIYEKVEEVKPVNKLIAIVCDRCGAEIPELKTYETRDFTLEFNSGESYPDDATGDVWEVEDLCNDCVSFLKELLLVNGFKINEYSY